MKTVFYGGSAIALAAMSGAPAMAQDVARNDDSDTIRVEQQLLTPAAGMLNDHMHESGEVMIGLRFVRRVDSGTNQLAWKLRQDDRVVVHEQTSARILTSVHIPEPVDLIVCDASFIGLAKVLEVPLGFARPGATLVALIKPQFEAARHEVGKKGVVRDAAVHARVCDEVREWLVSVGWDVLGIVPSPITGPQGNVEFLIAARNAAPTPMETP